MLVNMNEVLTSAKKNAYAVGLFNTVNLELARGVIAAAEKTGSPVIMGTAEVLLPVGPLEELANFIVPMAKKATVPVVIHFDHGLTAEKCVEALKLGFSSIMYDCSTEGYEVNVGKVKEMAYIAHCFNATIEGELGHVGNAEGSPEGTASADDPSRYFTDPEQARDFTERTKIDALAIAVGTAHGVYKFKPKLDFDRIARIAVTVPVPLVLHGGSGLSDQDFRTAIAKGISKVNIFTDINNAAASAAKKALMEGKTGLTDIIPFEVAAVQAAVEEKMRLFGSNNRG
jgi:fructose-bisphosphate aldolase class II